MQPAQDVDLVRDVDLAILGRHPWRFLEYEYGVEEEFAHLSSLVFAFRRGRFLASLLEAPAIYRTDHFRQRCEAQARANLERLLGGPGYGVWCWWRRLTGGGRRTTT